MARKKSARPELIRFYCSLATIQNAITFRGDGDGGRVVLEVPRSEAGALLLLQQYGAARLLHVTVEFVDKGGAPSEPNTDGPADWSEVMRRSIDNEDE